MADSLVNIDKRLLFRETFESEQSVRRNGGTPTGVTFSNGVASFSGSLLLYNQFLNGVYSIRIKLSSLTVAANTMFCDFRNQSTGSGVGYISGNPSGTLAVSSGTNYINGTASSTLTTSTKEIIVSGITINGKTIGIGRAWNTTWPITMSVELFEIYSGTLTAQEVSNLYNNSRYREVNSHGEQLGAELVVNGGFDTDTDWTKSGESWTISGGKANYDDINSLQYITPNIPLAFTIGKRYKLTYTISGLSSGTAGLNFATQSGTRLFDVYDTAVTATRANGTYTETCLCLVTSTNIRIYAYTSSTSSWSIDNLSIKEVLVESTKPILDVCACNGVARNKYSGDVYPDQKNLSNNFDTSAGLWTTTSAWVYDAVNKRINATNATGGFVHTIGQLTIGKTYELIFTISFTSGDLRIRFGTGNTVATLTTSGTYRYTGVLTTTDVIFFDPNTQFTGWIDSISIREVIPSVTPTTITYRKENDVIAMEFNGSTSKIDCGSYDGLVGDKTFVVWVNPTNKGTSQFIFSNGNFLLAFLTSGQIYFYSNGATAATGSGSTVIKYKQPNFIVVTRTSTGITNIYLNGVINGTANQSSGTPVSGSSNMTIGLAASDRTKGLIPSVRIYDGILTQEEISSIYTNEKKNYGL